MHFVCWCWNHHTDIWLPILASADRHSSPVYTVRFSQVSHRVVSRCTWLQRNKGKDLKAHRLAPIQSSKHAASARALYKAKECEWFEEAFRRVSRTGLHLQAVKKENELIPPFSIIKLYSIFLFIDNGSSKPLAILAENTHRNWRTVFYYLTPCCNFHCGVHLVLSVLNSCPSIVSSHV